MEEIKMIKAVIKKINRYNDTIVDEMYLECDNKNMLEDIIYYSRMHLDVIDMHLEVKILSEE